jgi:hypothetical protein
MPSAACAPLEPLVAWGAAGAGVVLVCVIVALLLAGVLLQRWSSAIPDELARGLAREQEHVRTLLELLSSKQRGGHEQQSAHEVFEELQGGGPQPGHELRGSEDLQKVMRSFLISSKATLLMTKPLIHDWGLDHRRRSLQPPRTIRGQP